MIKHLTREPFRIRDPQPKHFILKPTCFPGKLLVKRWCRICPGKTHDMFSSVQANNHDSGARRSWCFRSWAPSWLTKVPCHPHHVTRRVLYLGDVWSSRHKAAVELNHLLQEVMHLEIFHRTPFADIMRFPWLWAWQVWKTKRRCLAFTRRSLGMFFLTFRSGRVGSLYILVWVALSFCWTFLEKKWAYRQIAQDPESSKGAIDDELDLSQSWIVLDMQRGWRGEAPEPLPGLRHLQQRAAAKATWRVTPSAIPNARSRTSWEKGWMWPWMALVSGNAGS